MNGLIDFKSISVLFPNAYSFYTIAKDDLIESEEERLLDWIGREDCSFKVVHIPIKKYWNAHCYYDKEGESLVSKETLNLASYEDAFGSALYMCLEVLNFKFKPPKDSLWIDAVTVGAYKRQLTKDFWKSPKGLQILRNKKK